MTNEERAQYEFDRDHASQDDPLTYWWMAFVFLACPGIFLLFGLILPEAPK